MQDCYSLGGHWFLKLHIFASWKRQAQSMHIWIICDSFFNHELSYGDSPRTEPAPRRSWHKQDQIAQKQHPNTSISAMTRRTRLSSMGCSLGPSWKLKTYWVTRDLSRQNCWMIEQKKPLQQKASSRKNRRDTNSRRINWTRQWQLLMVTLKKKRSPAHNRDSSTNWWILTRVVLQLQRAILWFYQKGNQ